MSHAAVQFLLQINVSIYTTLCSSICMWLYWCVNARSKLCVRFA